MNPKKFLPNTTFSVQLPYIAGHSLQEHIYRDNIPLTFHKKKSSLNAYFHLLSWSKIFRSHFYNFPKPLVVDYFYTGICVLILRLNLKLLYPISILKYEEGFVFDIWIKYFQIFR